MLPLGGSSSRSSSMFGKDNGIRGINTVNKNVAISVAGLIISLILFFGGIRHCYINGYSYNLKCDKASCTFSHNDSKNLKMANMITLDRADIKLVEIARINSKGELVEDTAQQRQAGYSIKLKVADKTSIVGGRQLATFSIMLLSPYSLGRRVARSGWNQIKQYIEGKKDAAHFHHGQTMTLWGSLSLVAGLFSFAILGFFGQWSELTPAQRRTKKAS